MFNAIRIPLIRAFMVHILYTKNYKLQILSKMNIILISLSAVLMWSCGDIKTKKDTVTESNTPTEEVAPEKVHIVEDDVQDHLAESIKFDESIDQKKEDSSIDYDKEQFSLRL